MLFCIGVFHNVWSVFNIGEIKTYYLQKPFQKSVSIFQLCFNYVIFHSAVSQFEPLKNPFS